MIPLLSILIPTTTEREECFNKLINEFVRQTSELDDIDCVEILYDKTGKEVTVGEKREKLYQKANGKYSLQFDDDDWIHPQGLQLIIEALKNNPDVDCVTYEEYINKDGIEYTSRHSLEYQGWSGDWDKLLPSGYNFHRCPYFKSVIKTEIARSVAIEKIRFGEDHHFALDLIGKLNSEVHIPEKIYHYIHISSPFDSRYGFDKEQKVI